MNGGMIREGDKVRIVSNPMKPNHPFYKDYEGMIGKVGVVISRKADPYTYPDIDVRIEDPDVRREYGFYVRNLTKLEEA